LYLSDIKQTQSFSSYLVCLKNRGKTQLATSCGFGKIRPEKA